MNRTVLALIVASGLGLSGYLWAGDADGEKKGCPSAAAAKKEGGCSKSCADNKGGKAGCGKQKELAEYASYKRADEVLKSWQEAPARLAAMSQNNEGQIRAAFARLEETHPAGPVLKPTVAFLHKGLTTLARMDAAAGSMCAEADKPATQPAVADAHSGCCPKTAAAIASSRKKLERSMALTAKANELMLVAYKVGNEAGCPGHAKAEGKTGGCSGKPTADGREGACGKEKAKATLTAATGEKQCPKAAGSGCGAKTEATLTAATGEKRCCKAEGAGGCGSKAKATLTAGGEKQCAKAGGAGGCGAGKTTLTQADGPACCADDDKACCAAKRLTALGQAVVAESGELLAQWQGADIRLASLDRAEREAAEKAAATAGTLCPTGGRMPETLEAIAALLTDAAALNARAMAECEKNAAAGKAIPAELQQLARTRGQVISALINVLEKSNKIMRPARQVASAQ